MASPKSNKSFTVVKGFLYRQQPRLPGTVLEGLTEDLIDTLLKQGYIAPAGETQKPVEPSKADIAKKS